MLEAICTRKSDIANFLITLNLDLSIQDGNGNTSLHYAVEYKQLELSKVILSKNESLVNIENDHGNHPLWIACFKARLDKEYYKFIELLYKYNGDFHHANKVGKCPLDIAKRSGREDLKKFLDQLKGTTI